METDKIIISLSVIINFLITSCSDINKQENRENRLYWKSPHLKRPKTANA
jgi:hypothetical protein